MTMLNYIDGLTIKSVNIKSKDINSIEDLYDFVHFRNKNKGHRSSIKCETFDQGKLFIIYYTKPQNKKNTIMTTLNYVGIEIVTFGSACIIETSVSSTGFPKLEDVIKTTKTHADFTKAEDEEDDAEEEDDDAEDDAEEEDNDDEEDEDDDDEEDDEDNEEKNEELPFDELEPQISHETPKTKPKNNLEPVAPIKSKKLVVSHNNRDELEYENYSYKCCIRLFPF